MKFRFLLIFCFLALIAGCAKKSSEIPTLSFTLKSANAYINQTVSFNLAATNVTSYAWDFGDGTTQTTTSSAAHTYTQAGIFTIKVTSAGTSFSKRIRIYPGTGSFQFKNSFIRTFTAPTVDIYDTGGKELIPAKLTFNDLAIGATTDTIFVNIANLSYTPNITLGLSFKNSNNKIIGFSTNFFAVTVNMHSVYEITGALTGTYFYSNSTGSYISGNNTLTYADAVN